MKVLLAPDLVSLASAHVRPAAAQDNVYQTMWECRPNMATRIQLIG